MDSLEKKMPYFRQQGTRVPPLKRWPLAKLPPNFSILLCWLYVSTSFLTPPPSLKICDQLNHTYLFCFINVSVLSFQISILLPVPITIWISFEERVKCFSSWQEFILKRKNSPSTSVLPTKLEFTGIDKKVLQSPINILLFRRFKPANQF